MIKKLIQYFKEELSFKAIVASRRTRKQKFFFLLIVPYVLLLQVAIILILTDYLVTPSIIISLIIFVDIILLIFFKTGFLNWHRKRGNQIDLKILQAQKKKKNAAFTTREEGLYVIRERRLKKFFKNNHMEEDFPFILSSLRHRETFELAITVIVFSALMIGITTFLVKLIEFYAPLELLHDLYFKKQYPNASQTNINNLKLKISTLVVVVLGIISLVLIFPYYLFSESYFRLRFKTLKELQTLIEDIHLKQKKRL